MNLFDKLFGEFIDVIEWIDPPGDTLVYRFERYGNEIKYGAKLTVRESQVAVFVNEGQIADVFQAGLYELDTNNLPILTTLQSWPHAFESPFKAEVYFFNTRQFTDLKWGTKNPVMLRDPEFGPVRLRAFGTYSIRIKDPVTCLREIVGTDGYFTTDEITGQLRNLIVSRFSSILGESGIPVLDLAANYTDLSEYVTNVIRPEFVAYGLDVTTLLVENVSLPPVVEEALDKRSSMGVIGDLKDYMTFQTAEAMTAAADNPSGTAAAGISLGIGFAMANKMAQIMDKPAAPPPQPDPPPVVQGRQYYVVADGAQTGPFTLDALHGQIQGQELRRESLVWFAGMEDWTPAAQVPELMAQFNQTPPPVPGQ